MFCVSIYFSQILWEDKINGIIKGRQVYITCKSSGWSSFPIRPKYNISNWKTGSYYFYWLLEVIQPYAGRMNLLRTVLFNDTSNMLTSIWCHQCMFLDDREAKFSVTASSLCCSFQCNICAPVSLINFDILFILLP